MKELVVLSGKGGTGKTSIVGSFAALADSKVLADCDVDAADLHLLLDAKVKEETEFQSGQVPLIDENKCTECFLCEEICRFDAIKDFVVNAIAGEGCGFCHHVCPEKAITMQQSICGKWFISDTSFGPLVHARLGIAEENSGKLVSVVRQNAKRIAKEMDLQYIITDGPPGIGCPVISSLSGANLALVVTEPTLSGIHDLERVLSVCQHFGIPALVCINKYDLNEKNTKHIENYCRECGVPVAAKIKFNNVVTDALVKGLPVVKYSQDGLSENIELLWKTVKQVLDA